MYCIQCDPGKTSLVEVKMKRIARKREIEIDALIT